MLQSFRPQYMDEYEKYEAKLKQLYAIYVLKFRNVAYLQQLQEEFDRSEKQRSAEAEQNMRNMVERMRAQELLLRDAQYAFLHTFPDKGYFFRMCEGVTTSEFF
ncbi:unnamed protein product [Gongylonema pulchrum]|uniref:Complex I-B15 n=1 Tax=Gongylonema pulchrum TaxID=637853 RepID=A0A183CVB9_9BILA|nr:unnamed protein product [Gongylonema pulchrum]